MQQYKDMSKEELLLEKASLEAEYEKVKARADKQGCSVNDLIHTILENETKGE